MNSQLKLIWLLIIVAVSASPAQEAKKISFFVGIGMGISEVNYLEGDIHFSTKYSGGVSFYPCRLKYDHVEIVTLPVIGKEKVTLNSISAGYNIIETDLINILGYIGYGRVSSKEYNQPFPGIWVTDQGFNTREADCVSIQVEAELTLNQYSTLDLGGMIGSFKYGNFRDINFGFHIII